MAKEYTYTPEVVAPDLKYIWTVFGSMILYMIATIDKLPSFLPRYQIQILACLVFIIHITEAIYVLNRCLKCQVVNSAHTFLWVMQVLMWGFPAVIVFNEEYKIVNKIDEKMKKKDM